MSSLPEIPRPLPQKWNDFRLRFVPFIAFAAASIAVVIIWKGNWSPTSHIGQVIGPSASVTSPRDGKLLEGLVPPYSSVTNGQTLAILQVASSDNLRASIDAIQADMDIMRQRMMLDQHRNYQNYQGLRVELLDQEVNLAQAKANLKYAELEEERMARLLASKVVSPSEYDEAADRRDALRVEVIRRTELVTQLNASLQETEPPSLPQEDPIILETIAKATVAFEQKLAEAEGSIRLRAPLDGIVNRVLRRGGENVVAGEPIFEVSSPQPTEILGFVRQPLSFEPKVGDKMEVRTRGRPVVTGEATITRIGGRLELFTRPLRVRGFDSSQERGLPFILSLPEGLELHPGELVDLYSARKR